MSQEPAVPETKTLPTGEPAAAPAPGNSSESRTSNKIIPIPAIFCIGDSLTAYGNDVAVRGWMAQLADRVRMRADVINRGSAGFNTRMALDYFSAPEAYALVVEAVRAGRCHFVTLCFGGNDAAPPEVNAWQAVPLDEYGRNMLRLIDMVCGWGVPEERILVMAPPPVRPGQNSKRHADVTDRYAVRCQEVCATRKVRYMDVRDILSETSGSEGSRDFWVDGLHLNGEGNDLFYEAVERAVGDLLTKEALPYSHAHWSVYRAGKME